MESNPYPLPKPDPNSNGSNNDTDSGLTWWGVLIIIGFVGLLSGIVWVGCKTAKKSKVTLEEAKISLIGMEDTSL